MEHKLWYKKPASEWLEGLPVGTGRLAAMVMGRYKRERIALNHEWLWRGLNRKRENRKSAHLLPSVRELLLKGDYEAGTEEGNRAFGCFEGRKGGVKRVDAYQPAGDLYLEFNHAGVHDYTRELDLTSGCVSVTYQAGAVRVTRQVVAHLAEDLILIHVQAEGGPLDCALWLDRCVDPGCALKFGGTAGRIIMDGKIHKGTAFRVEAQVWPEGGDLVRGGDGKVLCRRVNALLVAVNAGTSACGRSPAAECSRGRLKNPAWDRLWSTHLRRYRREVGAMQLNLPVPEQELPTDERMRRLRGGDSDPGLVLLYFNYGRYLLCASSANASLPANLQGKWNEDLEPAWNCDYHHDVNLQMNYWPAEAAGLERYVEALLRHIERFVPHARKAARDIYGCNGVWFPLQSDAWGRATPEAFGWAVWVGAAAWLAQHMWWHYEYGQDVGFLRKRCYPFLKEVAAFYESYLIEDESGVLQIVPSQSPENHFVGGGSLSVSLCVSAAMDVQLAWDALSHAVRASEVLGKDERKRNVWKDMLKRLPSLKVGAEGQLLEWNQELEECNRGHRHMSHLFGLYPGEQIDPERTPVLWKAAAAALERRMAAKGGHTGWSRAWVACLYARLGQGDKAFEHVQHLITDFATDTLMDLHPPRIFQIEGNFGGVAAVVEMLLQSYYEELHFLPALPKAWPTGAVRGLRARGGYTVSLAWHGGKMTRAEVVSRKNGECVVKTRGRRLTVTGPSGRRLKVRKDGGRIRFRVRRGRTYLIQPV